MLASGVSHMRRRLSPSLVTQGDFLTPYVEDLDGVIDFEVIRSAGLKIGVDPMGVQRFTTGPADTYNGSA